jgi:hypothetical protein
MRFLAALLVALCWVSTTWSQITGVTPIQGGLGTEITISGSGFGTQKPKVQLVQAVPAPGKKARTFTLKVSSNSDTQVVARGDTGLLGLFNLSVTPAGRGTTALTRANAFSFRAPSVTSVSPTSGATDAVITITGLYFGTKKGFVAVGGKRVSVTAWTNTSVSFKVPKTLANGAYTVEVISKLGTGSKTNAFTVTGSQIGVSKTDVLTAKIGSFNFSAKKPFVNGAYVTTTKLVNIASFKRIGLSGSNQTFGIAGFMDLTKPMPQTLTQSNSDILIYFSNNVIKNFRLVRSDVYSTTDSRATYTLNLINYSGNRLSGTITGTLYEENTKKAIQLTSCSFTCTLVE